MSILREKNPHNYDLVSLNETLSYNNDLRCPNEKCMCAVPKQANMNICAMKYVLYKYMCYIKFSISFSLIEPSCVQVLLHTHVKCSLAQEVAMVTNEIASLC